LSEAVEFPDTYLSGTSLDLPEILATVKNTAPRTLKLGKTMIPQVVTSPELRDLTQGFESLS
jgi:hypothetical protein